MNTALLKLAVDRKRGYRAWAASGGKVRYMVPRLGMWPSGALKGWHLSWQVTGGVRGINATMHPSLARAIAHDILSGTNSTRYGAAL